MQIGNEKLVEYLCSEMNVNVKDCLGRTPLHLAATKDNPTILKMLIASNSDVNSQSISGEIPLIKAIKFNQYENVKLLLRFGSNSELRVNVSSLNYIKNLYNAEDYALREDRSEIATLVRCYQSIKCKLVLVLHGYVQGKKNSSKSSILTQLSPKVIQKLTGYIIP